MKFNFIKAVKEILEEQGKTTADLFNDKVVSENTFYKYNQRNPSLTTLIKIANYLKVSIDYLYELKDVNDFKPYCEQQTNFYDKLMSMITSAKISCRKFSKDLHYSRDNVLRWKKGTEPSVQCLLEIANYFKCSVDDLLDRE